MIQHLPGQVCLYSFLSGSRELQGDARPGQRPAGSAIWPGVDGPVRAHVGDGDQREPVIEAAADAEADYEGEYDEEGVSVATPDPGPLATGLAAEDPGVADGTVLLAIDHQIGRRMEGAEQRFSDGARLVACRVPDLVEEMVSHLSSLTKQVRVEVAFQRLIQTDFGARLDALREGCGGGALPPAKRKERALPHTRSEQIVMDCRCHARRRCPTTLGDKLLLHRCPATSSTRAPRARKSGRMARPARTGRVCRLPQSTGRRHQRRPRHRPGSQRLRACHRPEPTLRILLTHGRR